MPTALRASKVRLSIKLRPDRIILDFDLHARREGDLGEALRTSIVEFITEL
jgi:hypothetical protein